MSKAQWGNGYYTGLKKGKELSINGIKPNYLLIYDKNNILSLAYKILENLGNDNLLVEIIDFLDLLMINQGYFINENCIDYKNVREINLKEFEKYKFIYNQKSMINDIQNFLKTMGGN